MPPFNKRQAPEVKRHTQEVKRPIENKPRKSLEDFAQEIFGQLEQKKAEVQKTVQRTAQIEKEVVKEQQQIIDAVPRAVSLAEVKESTPRIKIEETPRIQVMKAKETAIFTVPRTKQALAQAIVTAEILGPPKALERQKR